MPPKYFIQTNSGAYNNMLRHNIEFALTNTLPGTSITFSEMLPFKKTLEMFVESTGKNADQYFQLLPKSPLLFTPYTDTTNSKLNMQGF